MYHLRLFGKNIMKKNKKYFPTCLGLEKLLFRAIKAHFLVQEQETSQFESVVVVPDTIKLNSEFECNNAVMPRIKIDL